MLKDLGWEFDNLNFGFSPAKSSFVTLSHTDLWYLKNWEDRWDIPSNKFPTSSKILWTKNKAKIPPVSDQKWQDKIRKIKVKGSIRQRFP